MRQRKVGPTTAPDVHSHTVGRMTLREVTRDRCLYYASNEQVDIICISVNHLQPLHYFLWDYISQEVKVIDPAKAAELPESVVSWQTVVSPSLDVEGHEVHAEALVLALEEVVGDLFREDVVELLSWLGGESDQELVELPRGVDQLGVEKSVGQWDHAGLLTLVVNLLYETATQ